MIMNYCTIRNLKDKEDVVYLGEPAGIYYKSGHNPFPPAYEMEDYMDMEDILMERSEINGMANIVLCWEEEALQGQVD
jgi:hypothetical protein